MRSRTSSGLPLQGIKQDGKACGWIRSEIDSSAVGRRSLARFLRTPKQLTMAFIKEFNGRKRSGCFDVFAWKENASIFIESKKFAEDSIRQNQIRWLDAALKSGYSPELHSVVAPLLTWLQTRAAARTGRRVSVLPGFEDCRWVRSKRPVHYRQLSRHTTLRRVRGEYQFGCQHSRAHESGQRPASSCSGKVRIAWQLRTALN